MLQAVMESPGQIAFREVPMPKPDSGQVLIKVKSIGVCGSDIHVYHGKHPYTSYPVVQGHEVSGVIEELGSNIKGYSIGDKVTFQPQVVCGTCYQCTHGRYNICDNLKVMGFQTTGAASEYFVCDVQKLVKLDNSYDYDKAAMIEPVAVAVSAVRKAGDMSGKKVIVYGAGTIGNLTAQVCKAQGADKVIITDISDYRLELALRCGIDYAVNTAKSELGTFIAQHFGDDKADIQIECVGASATLSQAIEYARKGTDIIVVGVFGEKPSVDIGLIQDRELNVRGTAMYMTPDFIDAVKLISDEKVYPERLITAKFPFDEYLDAYKYIEDNGERAMKVIIMMP